MSATSLIWTHIYPRHLKFGHTPPTYKFSFCFLVMLFIVIMFLQNLSPASKRTKCGRGVRNEERGEGRMCKGGEGLRERVERVKRLSSLPFRKHVHASMFCFLICSVSRFSLFSSECRTCKTNGKQKTSFRIQTRFSRSFSSALYRLHAPPNKNKTV